MHLLQCYYNLIFFFSNDPATTEIYTLSLHDALPILHGSRGDKTRTLIASSLRPAIDRAAGPLLPAVRLAISRSEEHTSELQSQSNLVCRLLLEKKKKKKYLL